MNKSKRANKIKRNDGYLMIGGQAVIEGVMMKSKDFVSTAVRKPNGKISVRTRRTSSWVTKLNLNKIPFIRGVLVLFETMILGLKELNYSANESLDEENEDLGFWEITGTLLFSLFIIIVIFKLLPLAIANFFAKNNNWLLNIIDGVVKISIFIIYLLLISLMKDVKNLFKYHGAEHKSVNAYEHYKNINKLTVKRVKKFTRAQPRCGTTFVIYVLFLSIFVYVLIPLNFNFWIKLLLRIALLPVIAGIAYELIRFAGKYYYKSLIVRIISSPGMFFQKLTTKEPNEKQLAVGIKALKEVNIAKKKEEKQRKKINKKRKEEKEKLRKDKKDKKRSRKSKKRLKRSY